MHPPVLCTQSSAPHTAVCSLLIRQVVLQCSTVVEWSSEKSTPFVTVTLSAHSPSLFLSFPLVMSRPVLVWDTLIQRDFEYRGFACRMKQTVYTGKWNGYVALPSNHAIWTDYASVEALSNDVDVHGGITFCGEGYIGWDTCHADDAPFAPGSPMAQDVLGSGDEDLLSIMFGGDHLRWWTVGMVETETKRLVDQLIQLTLARTPSPTDVTQTEEEEETVAD
jgi:hypothetical protein